MRDLKKTPDITRNIRLQSKRKDGDAPDLGPINRVKDSGMYSSGQRVRRRPKGVIAARRRSIVIWSIFLGLLTLALIGFAIYAWMYPYLFPDTG